MKTPTLLTLLMLVASLPARAQDWPQFRGPTGQGLSTAKNVPVEWGATKNVAWKTPIPGRAWSSPVLVGGKLYLTTATGDNASPSLRAMCVDADGGKVLWDVELFKPTPDLARVLHEKNSQASPTPVVADGRMYAHFGHLGTAALDLSGKVLWRRTVTYPPAHGNGGSPVLVDGLLVFSCDGTEDPFVVALDAKTGDERWRTPRNTPAKRKFSVGTPQVITLDDGSTQVVSPASGFVGGYDPKDGREIWRVRYGEGYSVVPQPAYANGIVVVSSGYDSPVTFAIRPAGASGDVTESNVAWQSRKNAPNTPSPLIVGDELYMVADNGIATCTDLRSGKMHWSERLEGNYSASPIAAEGRVYFQNEDGLGSVVRASTSFELLGENDLEERSLASYAVTDGTLFIRTENHLWKIAATR